MRVLKNRVVSRFTQKNGISDSDLWGAVKRAERGLVDADLGGGVIKQRVARSGAGKSGGFRTVLLFRVHHRAIFVFAFAKNAKANISARELKTARGLAKVFLNLSDVELEAVISAGELIEVKGDAKEIS